MSQHTITNELSNWQTSPEIQKSDPNLLRYCRTCFKDYAGHPLGYPTSSMKTKEFQQFCDSTSVAEVIKKGIKLYEKESKVSDEKETAPTPPLTQSELLEFFCQIVNRELDAAVTAGQITSGTANNYRSSFRRYWKWQFEQSWVRELLAERLRARQIPEFMPRHPGADKRVSTRSREEISYAVRQDDLPACAINQISEYKDFRLTGGKLAKKKLRTKLEQLGDNRRILPEIGKIQLSTFENEEQIILMFYGYCLKEQRYELSQLEFDLLLKWELLEDYVDWLVDERGCTYSSGVNLIKVATAVAKYLNFEETKRSDYLDVQIILDLKDLARQYQKEYQQNKKKSDKKKWRFKELTYPQLFEVVDYLLSCCAPNLSKVSQSNQSPGKLIKGDKRSLEAVVQARQIHLLVKILVLAPWRQSEIRQWALGKTLFRRDDGSGQSFYDVILEKHKLSEQNGDLARKLPTELTADLDDWINQWRQEVVKAVQTLEGWLEFAGYKLEDVEKLQQRLEAAKLGQSKRRVKNQQKYIKRLEAKLRALQHRIAAWETAKANMDANDTLFFSFSSSSLESFGKPVTMQGLYSIVTTALAKATLHLFGESKRLNPHGFRHIAIKHCLEIHGDREALAVYMNHSRQTQDKYLQQIFDSYKYTEKFVDDWWKKKL